MPTWGSVLMHGNRQSPVVPSSGWVTREPAGHTPGARVHGFLIRALRTPFRPTLSTSMVAVTLQGVVHIRCYVSQKFTARLRDSFSNLLRTEAGERSHRLAGVLGADVERGVGGEILWNLDLVGHVAEVGPETPRGWDSGV